MPGETVTKLYYEYYTRTFFKKLKKLNISQDHYLVRCDWRSFHHKMYKVNITITRVYSMYGYDASLLTANYSLMHCTQKHDSMFSNRC